MVVHFLPTTVRPQRWEKAFHDSPPGHAFLIRKRVGNNTAALSTLMCDTDADADACASLALPLLFASSTGPEVTPI